MKLKKIIAAAVALVLLLTLSVTVFAAHPFVDVTDDSWYAEAVDYVYEHELMSGIGTISFGPDTYMTRAMLVTVLYRLAGSPDVSGDIPFVDVPDDAYYYAPVKWCYENGIAAGTSRNAFSPDANISREQMVTIFARYAESKGLDISDGANLSIYNDLEAVSVYALSPFEWAVKAGIVSGTSADTLTPQGTATRAQCAVIMQRFIEWTDSVSETPEVTLTVVPTSTPVVPTATPVVTPDADPTPVPTVQPTPDDSGLREEELPIG